MVGLLLDTNAAIDLIELDPVLPLLLTGRDVFTSSIVMGELYFGAYKSERVTQNVSRVDSFGSGIDILLCDTETAIIYGPIKAQLRRIGRPIPDNDIWIAACVMQHDLEVVTRDGHFKHVQGLKTSAW